MLPPSACRGFLPFELRRRTFDRSRSLRRL